MMKNCKKCLLLEAGENVTHSEIINYIQSLDKQLLVSDDVYNDRLGNCKKCENLISGMCLKCGCYVEVRAALKENDCPDYNNRRWNKYATV